MCIMIDREKLKRTVRIHLYSLSKRRLEKTQRTGQIKGLIELKTL